VVNRKLIYQKTAMGVEEIQSRRYKLPKRPRMLLILVDGRTPLDIVLTQAHALGIEDSAVYELIEAGFIAPLAAAGPGGDGELLAAGDPDTRFRLAQRFMNETAVNALGLRALFFTLKLERCATLADLQALLEDYRRAMLKGGEPAEAAVLVAKVRSLIG